MTTIWSTPCWHRWSQAARLCTSATPRRTSSSAAPSRSASPFASDVPDSADALGGQHPIHPRVSAARRVVRPVDTARGERIEHALAGDEEGCRADGQLVAEAFAVAEV